MPAVNSHPREANCASPDVTSGGQPVRSRMVKRWRGGPGPSRVQDGYASSAKPDPAIDGRRPSGSRPGAGEADSVTRPISRKARHAHLMIGLAAIEPGGAAWGWGRGNTKIEVVGLRDPSPTSSAHLSVGVGQEGRSLLWVVLVV
jgi:hypothetical protein